MITPALYRLFLPSLLLIVVMLTVGCSGQNEESLAEPSTDPAPDEAALVQTASPYDALPAAVRVALDKPFTGDFDELVKRRAIRVAVTFNRTHYFIDKGQERGLTYEWLKIFEDDLNKDLKTGKLKVCLLYTSPSPRDS